MLVKSNNGKADTESHVRYANGGTANTNGNSEVIEIYLDETPEKQ